MACAIATPRCDSVRTAFASSTSAAASAVRLLTRCGLRAGGRLLQSSKLAVGVHHRARQLRPLAFVRAEEREPLVQSRRDRGITLLGVGNPLRQHRQRLIGDGEVTIALAEHAHALVQLGDRGGDPPLHLLRCVLQTGKLHTPVGEVVLALAQHTHARIKLIPLLGEPILARGQLFGDLRFFLRSVSRSRSRSPSTASR